VGSSLSRPRFARHIDDLYEDLDGLLEAAEAVRVTVNSPGWVHIARMLEAEIATLDRSLDDASSPKEQAEYALAHGRRGGLRGADEAAGTILHDAELRLARQHVKHEGGAGDPVSAGVV
jgi:hypothetical protein